MYKENVFVCQLYTNAALSWALSPSPSASESECCGATQHNTPRGPAWRHRTTDRQQTPAQQRALAQQARTPSCGGHGVSHARLPGRPLGPRRDLLTAHLLRNDDNIIVTVIVPCGKASDLRVGGLHGSVPVAACNDDMEDEGDDRHATVTDKRRGPQPPAPTGGDDTLPYAKQSNNEPERPRETALLFPLRLCRGDSPPTGQGNRSSN